MHAKCMYCSAAVLPGVPVPMLLLGSAQGCKVLHSALHDANLAETPGINCVILQPKFVRLRLIKPDTITANI